MEQLPKYPDLRGREDIKDIEDAARKAGHLGEEGLLERIDQDMVILQEKNLAKEDIYQNHRNMVRVFVEMGELVSDNFLNIIQDRRKENIPDEDKKKIERKLTSLKKIDELRDTMCIINRWSYSSTFRTKFLTFNGCNFVVSHVGWGKREECPIKTYFDKKNELIMNFPIRKKDWLIYNIDLDIGIWVHNLLFTQIGLWGFCHSFSSPYRLDLERYLAVMNVSQPVRPLPTKVEKFWGFCEGVPESFLRSIKVLSYHNGKGYEAFIGQQYNTFTEKYDEPALYVSKKPGLKLNHIIIDDYLLDFCYVIGPHKSKLIKKTQTVIDWEKINAI